VAPRAKIITFEPHPSTFARLRLAAERGNFQAVNLGCSDVTGEGVLFDYLSAPDGSTHASMHSATFGSFHQAPSCGRTVALVRLDDFAAANGIKSIDLLKIDTEGHELKVLHGAGGLLSNGAIRTIQFEFNSLHVLTRVFMKDFFDLLSDYSLFRLLPSGLLPLGEYGFLMHEIFAFQNVIAIRKG